MPRSEAADDQPKKVCNPPAKRVRIPPPVPLLPMTDRTPEQRGRKAHQQRGSPIRRREDSDTWEHDRQWMQALPPQDEKQTGSGCRPLSMVGPTKVRLGGVEHLTLSVRPRGVDSTAGAVTEGEDKMMTTDITQTPIITKTLYHGTTRERADAILAQGFRLCEVKPRWVNGLAISTLTSANAVRRYFGKREVVVLRLKVRGRIYRAGRFEGGPIQHATDAKDYTRQMVAADYAATHLQGGTVYIYDPDNAIQSVEEEAA